MSIDVPWCFGLGCRKEGNEALKRAWRRSGAAARVRKASAVSAQQGQGAHETAVAAAAEGTLETEHEAATRVARAVVQAARADSRARAAGAVSDDSEA